MSSRILCLGGAVLDRKYRGRAMLRPGTSNPVDSTQSFGGVARNVAETLARLGCDVALGSLVGADGRGDALLRHLASLGIDTTGIGRSADHVTAEYAAILEPDGSLALGLADMAIFDALTPAWLDALASLPDTAGIVFADSNLPAETLAALLARRRGGRRWQLAIDAVSTHKVTRLPGDLAGLDLLFLNLDEARTLAALPDAGPETAAAVLRAAGAGAVIVTLGHDGSLLADAVGQHRLPAVPVRAMVDVTGAGDALIGGTLATLAAGRPLPDALSDGLLAATLTIEHADSVRPDLTRTLLEAAATRRDP